MALRCEVCKHKNCPSDQYPCSECDRNANDLFMDEGKQTQGDKIREMSDEELYNLIEKIKMCGGLIRTETTSSECRGCKDGFCCNVLQWLKSEVKE